MSHKRTTASMEAGGNKRDLLLESVQQCLTRLTEDRDEAAERTHSIVARFFKVAIAIVCLNVVIAGANVAMILFRSGRTPAPVVAPVAVTTPAAEIAQPVALPPAQPASAAIPVDDDAASAKQPPAAPTQEQPAPAVPAPAAEKRVPLLGTPPSAKPASPSRGAPVLATRPIRPAAKSMMVKPYLASDQLDDDGRPFPPPERW